MMLPVPRPISGYRMCKTYGPQLPRRYRRKARKDYLAFAKSRKHGKKQVRTAIRKQFSYVRRDIGYLEGYFSQGYVPDTKDIPFIQTIFKLYEQQEYMYKNIVHSVPDRIVSISQSWIGRLEKVSFDAYNESGCLIEAAERYKLRTGSYPERVRADQIYRTRDNRAYCKEHGIRLSGPNLGRPSANAKTDKKQEYQDNTDRIEVERYFSRSKRCYGLGYIVTKLEEKQLTSIGGYCLKVAALDSKWEFCVQLYPTMDFRSADSSLLRGRSLYGGTEAESVCCDGGLAL